jgi:hypothetical protein
VKERDTRLVDELASGLRQFDDLVVALKEPETKLAFEFLDPLADRGLVDPQSLSGP